MVIGVDVCPFSSFSLPNIKEQVAQGCFEYPFFDPQPNISTGPKARHYPGAVLVAFSNQLPIRWISEHSPPTNKSSCVSTSKLAFGDSNPF